MHGSSRHPLLILGGQARDENPAGTRLESCPVPLVLHPRYQVCALVLAIRPSRMWPRSNTNHWKVNVPDTAPPRFLPQLEGLRAVAAVGVVLTHVGFQTGLSQGTVVGAIVARFDYFVAVFFALSAFLLWRGFRREGYYRRRAARILPAYWSCVVVVLAFVPAAFGTSPLVSLTTLTLTQIYFADHLAGGLTHLWSLCVEVAFYAVLPVIFALGQRTASRRRRIAMFMALALVGLAWAGLPWPQPGVNFQIFPFSYLPWFVVGLIAAECEGRVRLPQWCRLLAWPLALLVCWVAAQEWFGPLGLEHPSPAAFVRRIVGGTVFAALVLFPYAWGRPTGVLATPWIVRLGTWSYSLFLWHLPVLSFVLPLAGVNLFSGSVGDFLSVSLLTVAASIVVAAASYAWIEQPARAWLAVRGGSGHERDSARRSQSGS